MKKKTVGIIVVVLVIHMLLAFAAFGPSVYTDLKELPLGILSLDKGSDNMDAIGMQLQDQITQVERKEILWKSYSSEDELYKAINNKEVYGAIILPENMTVSVLSLHTTEPQQAIVRILINEGVNTTGAHTANAIFSEIVTSINQEFRNDILTGISENEAPLSLQQAESIAMPLIQHIELTNPVGTPEQAQLPLIFTVLLWLGSMIGALMIWIMLHHDGQKPGLFIKKQLGLGAGLAILQSFSAMLIVSKILNIEVALRWNLILAIIITAFFFYVIQSTVLNWLGFKGWPLLIMVWLFAPSVINLPPEMLSDFYRTAIYSWSPMRYNTEALKSVLYFDSGADFGRMLAILVITSIVFMGLLTASYKRLSKKDLSKNPLAKRTSA